MIPKWLLVAVLAGAGCDRTRAMQAEAETAVKAEKLADETFEAHIRQATLCPGGAGDVWAYDTWGSAFPAPAGARTPVGLQAPFRIGIPFWCASPRRGTLKAKANITIVTVAGTHLVETFGVEDLGPLTLSEQAWGWFVAFFGAQLIMLFLIFNSLHWTLRTQLTSLVALPVGGYLSYRAFNTGLAVVACLALQIAVSLVLLAIVRLAARLRSG